MARLTKKSYETLGGPLGGYYTSEPIGIEFEAKMINKLGKLEDIEEELGVDLIKLLTARTIFTIDKVYGIFYHIDIENGGVYTSEYDADDEFYPFSDYGRTWAFTRKELEK